MNPSLGHPPRLLHLRYTTATRFVFATNEATLSRLVRAVLNIAGARILAFCIADNHVHIIVEVVGDGPWVAVRAITQTLTRSGGQRLSPTWSAPVEDQKHLRNLVRYLIRQPSHHGIGVPDALWPGSSLPDLVGARRLGTYDPARLRAHLPRLRPADLLADVGLPALEPLGPAALARVGPADIVAAAARTVARPGLGGREDDALRARRAAITVMRRADLPLTCAHILLGVSPNTVRRDVAVGAEEVAVEAVCRQLALHKLVEQRAMYALPGAK